MPGSISKIVKAIIIGAPGSGKGTISSRIVKDFGMKHLSSGDMLRAQILQKTGNVTFFFFVFIFLLLNWK